MRLTLRTLLAYRDGVLSPADYEDLHRRIQQSPDAGNLLRRINDLVASSELLSPKVDLTGLKGPNVIAEYLDDVLISSRIAELERLCLEYSEHLVELAHCHQLIAQAMNTHVEVSEDLQKKALELIEPAKREQIRSQLLTRSRKLSKQVITAEVVESPAASTAMVTTSVTAPNADKQTVASNPPVTSVTSTPQQAGLNLEGASLTTEVPEYLLGSRKRRWQIPAAILALTAALFLLVWQSVGSWDNLQALMVAQLDSEPAKPVENNLPAEKDPNKSKDKEPASNQNPNETKDGSASSNDAVIAGKDPTDNASTANSSAKATPEKSTSESSSTDKTALDNTAMPPDKDAEPAADKSTDASPPPTIEPAKLTGLNWNPVDENEFRSVVLLSNDDGVKLIEEATGTISEGKLIVPPASRTTFEAGPWKWQVIGPGSMVVNVKDGKLAISTSMSRSMVSAAQPGESFTLKTPCGDYELRVQDRAVWLGIEVSYRAVAKGSLTEANVYAPVLVIVVGADGATTSQELLSVSKTDNSQVVKITSAGNGVAVIKQNEMESFALQSPPAWYRKRSVRAIDQLGMADFHAAMAMSNEPVAQRLRAIASDPRPEVAAMAIQTAVLMGDWQPFATELLSNDRMRSHWTPTIQVARQMIATNPTTIKELQAEAKAKLGVDADRVLELLVGLEAAVQTNDALTGLVKGLDSNSPLPIRVLTAYELKHLTGEDFSYQPHAPVKAMVQQWRSKIAGNKVSFLPLADPIFERNPK